MTRVFDISGRLCRWFAVICCVILAVTALMTVLDVIGREAGISFGHRVALTEYGLLYVSMLGAPYLVRTSGHIFVDALLKAVPGGVRLVVEKVIYLLCIAICLYLGWFCIDLGLRAIETGDFDSRSFDLPRWLIYLPMVVGFLLSAVEFLRYVVGRQSMYDTHDPDAAL